MNHTTLIPCVIGLISLVGLVCIVISFFEKDHDTTRNRKITQPKKQNDQSSTILDSINYDMFDNDYAEVDLDDND